jgi:Transposase DDE domain
VLCRQFNLFTRAVVAIDGSKFKAVNNRDKNFTVTKVAKRMEQVEASIARYLAALDRADRQDGDVAEAKTTRLKEKIEGLRRQMQSLKAMGKQVEASPDKQVSLTDPDARSMATSGKGTGIVGYNVQIAVDAEHHLIVAHEVTNIGSDRAQLTSMSHKARDATGCEEVTVLADRGYYNGDEVLACEGTGILPCIPKTQTSGNAKRGLFTVADFIYDAEKDRYTCPAGKFLTRGKVRSDRRDNIDHYRNLTACSACALKPRCRKGSTAYRTPWPSAGRPSSIRSQASRHGWAAPIS